VVVTSLTDRLMEAGYVAREPHPSDRRMRILTPTEAGRAQIQEQLAPVLAAADRVVSWLREDEVALVVRFLDELVVLKEGEAGATPGPEPERIREGRRRSTWGQLAAPRYDPAT
jgi:hypothetical protein